MGRLRFYVHAESQTPLYVQQTQFLNAEGSRIKYAPNGKRRI